MYQLAARVPTAPGIAQESGIDKNRGRERTPPAILGVNRRLPFGAADEICERARPARHSSTRGRQDLRARAAGQTLEHARPTRSASARGPTRSASARGQVRRGPRFHRRNLCDLQVCLCSCSGLRPYPSVTFQTTIVELIVANSAHWNSQKMLEQPRIEQSDAVALAVAWRRSGDEF